MPRFLAVPFVFAVFLPLAVALVMVFSERGGAGAWQGLLPLVAALLAPGVLMWAAALLARRDPFTYLCLLMLVAVDLVVLVVLQGMGPFALAAVAILGSAVALALLVVAVLVRFTASR